MQIQNSDALTDDDDDAKTAVSTPDPNPKPRWVSSGYSGFLP